MIQVRDVHKSYPTRFGEKTVLRGINFDLARGDRLGILGRNGAGKSTLIRLISGAEKPTSGTIESSMSISWPLAFGGAFQPQLTGVDNVRFITSIYDQDFDRNIAFVEDFAELGPYLREPVRSYSSGMRARLAFAISMIIEFDCFLIDEIGAVGDARFHDRCNHELFEVRGDRAMIIISHNASYVRQNCNRWAILHEGKLTLCDDFEEAYEEYKELIGANTRAQAQPVSFTNRARMIESSQHAALSDERFRALTQQADWARDQKQRQRAAEHYAKALALYPYQSSYWAQLGHMHKEQGEFAEAEVAYRTSVALGKPIADVEPHIKNVVKKQAGDYYYSAMHLPSDGPASEQPPTRPDIDWLSWMLRGQAQPSTDEYLRALRLYPNLDSLCASMLTEQSDALAGEKCTAQDAARLRQFAICQFGDALPDAARKQLEKSGASPEKLLAALKQQGAFARWPKTAAALAAQDPQMAA
ncbi:ATP-binding cassette domain-containing protein [Altererythrobacter sp. JGD-16]|uniref:ATP-binding cassette domain-containing protein n=1 Tax=Altererythrobacter lutimaris TaxID=2743979 RepID=A0A850HHY6_9SPHN|nr:ATP-binding cassette domain-containing protein [Altererythrobacter lutimaris]